jgi:hypothetical protein
VAPLGGAPLACRPVNAPEVLETIEGALDDIALAIQAFVVIILHLAIGAWRDDGCRTAMLKPPSQCVTIIALVSDHLTCRRDSRQALVRGHVIAGVSGADRHHAGASPGIGHEVDLGGPSALGTADTMSQSPPFAPPDVRCALTMVESIITRSGAPSAPARAENMPSQMPRSAQRT